MRTTILFLATAALVAAPLAAAEAAPTTYRVSASVSDDKLDLTSHDGSNRSTRIKGKVSGGKVKGQKVYLYASNTSARNQSYTYIGSDKLSSSGRFDTKWKPKDGGTYLIKAVKRAGSGRAEGSDRTRVYVYRFTNLAKFDANAANPAVRRVDKAGSVRGQNWSTAYEIDPGTTATFTTQGYYCFRINFKIGVSDRTGGSGSYRIHQGGRTIKQGTLSRGDRFVEPTKTETKRMRAGQPVSIDVTGTTFVLGNPKAACTYPARTAAIR
ncbi:MAG: hypothetical protein ABWX74_11555 [Aeromicrobium sp.]